MSRERPNQPAVCPTCGASLKTGTCSRCTSTRQQRAARRVATPLGLDDTATVVRGFRPGELVGKRFRLESLMAEGSLSTVHLAHDLELDQQVALKSLSPELCRDTDALLRFERETRLLAKLKHPHLVTVTKVGWRGALPWTANWLMTSS